MGFSDLMKLDIVSFKLEITARYSNLSFVAWFLSRRFQP
jgi:hypothetical protein